MPIELSLRRRMRDEQGHLLNERLRSHPSTGQTFGVATRVYVQTAEASTIISVILNALYEGPFLPPKLLLRLPFSLNPSDLTFLVVDYH